MVNAEHVGFRLHACVCGVRLRMRVSEWVRASAAHARGVAGDQYVRTRMGLGGIRTRRCELCWCNHATRANDPPRLAARTGQHLSECASVKIFLVCTLVGLVLPENRIPGDKGLRVRQLE